MERPIILDKHNMVDRITIPQTGLYSVNPFTSLDRMLIQSLNHGIMLELIPFVETYKINDLEIIDLGVL